MESKDYKEKEDAIKALDEQFEVKSSELKEELAELEEHVEVARDFADGKPIEIEEKPIPLTNQVRVDKGELARLKHKASRFEASEKMSVEVKQSATAEIEKTQAELQAYKVTKDREVQNRIEQARLELEVQKENAINQAKIQIEKESKERLAQANKMEKENTLNAQKNKAYYNELKSYHERNKDSITIIQERENWKSAYERLDLEFDGYVERVKGNFEELEIDLERANENEVCFNCNWGDFA